MPFARPRKGASLVARNLLILPTYSKLWSLECFPDSHFYVELLIHRVFFHVQTSKHSQTFTFIPHIVTHSSDSSDSPVEFPAGNHWPNGTIQQITGMQWVRDGRRVVLWIYDNGSSSLKKKFFPCSYLTFRSQIFKYVPSEVFSSIRSWKLDRPFT